jgi:hypothetical protein
MSSGKIITTSTSKNSADANDIILRQTNMTKLIFRPQLVVNNNNEKAAVHGTFIFLKKGKNDLWQILDEITLARLKKGEGVKLFLHSEELLIFYEGISKLYQLYEQHGLPQGNQTFVNVSNRLQSVANLSDNDFKQLIDIGNDVGLKALLRLLKWANNITDISAVLDQLESLDISNLQKIHTISGIAALHNSLKIWDNNSSNSSEQFWQDQFTINSFLLEQIFSYPVVLIKTKAYLGGKSVCNNGGNYCDFLYKNALTRNAILVEIKAPTTPLLRTEYREGIYNASAQLTGAILQVLDYRKSLTEEFRILSKNDDLDTCEPPCKVIIGNSSELKDPEKKKSFELFRRHFNGVEILTFDEIFLRISNLLTILEGKNIDV